MRLLRAIFDRFTDRTQQDPLRDFYENATPDQIENHEAIVDAVLELSRGNETSPSVGKNFPVEGSEVTVVDRDKATVVTVRLPTLAH